MKQMKLPDDMKENIDFSDTSLPYTVRVLKPLLYKDGDAYCVVLGPNPTEGVFGCGKSAIEAFNDWDIHLKERIKNPEASDEVANYIMKEI
jgi:hypothetical protein